MSSSVEPEKKRSRLDENDQVEGEEKEAIKELPKGWEKRMSRSNSLFRIYLKITFLFINNFELKSRKYNISQFFLAMINSFVQSSDRFYYFNVYTGRSQWERPTKPADPAQASLNEVCFEAYFSNCFAFSAIREIYKDSLIRINPLN